MSKPNNSSSSSFVYQITIIGILFFIFGFVTWLNGTLIPFLKLACNLQSDAQALLVTSAFYISYFFLAIPSSAILKKTGFKNGMAMGLVVMALGSLIFIPAASARSFPLFLLGLFTQGMGLALLQTASNPYISIIGPIESAAKRISIMGICNKVAGILSPLILSSIVLKNASAIEEQIKTTTDVAQKDALLNQLISRIETPYMVMAVVLFALSLMIRRSNLPEIDTNVEDNTSDTSLSRNKTSALQFPHLMLGVLALFCFVGLEVLSGDGITIYGKELGFSLDETKYFTPFTLGAMLLGYILSIILIPKFISQQDFLKYSCILGILLTVVLYFSTGKTAVGLVAALGLANAVMWPAIFPLAINGLGRFTQIGSAYLIMAIAGGAILPQIYAFLKTTMPFNLAFMITLLPCYLIILYFATKGHKAGM